MEKIRKELIQNLARLHKEFKYRYPSSREFEHILWMLYNPDGVCEECTSTWEDGDCTCRDCKYNDLNTEDLPFNEPCDNSHFCVCDYFDGKPNEEEMQNFIIQLSLEELSDFERSYFHNYLVLPSIKAKIVDEIMNLIICFIKNDNCYENKLELSILLNNKIIDYLNIINFSLDKYEITNQLFHIMKDYINHDMSSIIFRIDHNIERKDIKDSEYFNFLVKVLEKFKNNNSYDSYLTELKKKNRSYY